MIMMKFQQSPLYFIEKVWELRPQPVKEECRPEVEEYLKNGELEKIKKKHFDRFVKGKHITWQQWVILLAVEEALKTGKNKITVVTGHDIGKSATMAMLIVWYLFCYLDSQIGATAPTSEQIHDVLWKEVAKWMGEMPQELKELDLFEWQSGYIRVKEKPETWFARARTARKENPEAIAGLHGDHVLIIADEAPGVPDEIFRSAEGSLTGPNTLVILIGNGTRNTGYFYDTHHTDKAHWRTLSFNSEDSPIVKEGYIERMEAKYGRDSDEFKIRVMGGFPAAEQMDAQGWIPLLTDNQVNRVSAGIEFVAGRKILGIDPAGEGDNLTTWVLRDNFHARVIATEADSTEKTIALKTSELVKEHGIDWGDVILDNFGVGANVARELLLIDHTAGITAINWGEDASDEEVYLNKRAECCFAAKEWFARGGGIVGDELQRDITAYMYRNTMSGKRQILDKPRLVQKLGRSPDRGDAFFLTFYHGADLVGANVQHGVSRKTTKEDIYSPI